MKEITAVIIVTAQFPDDDLEDPNTHRTTLDNVCRCEAILEDAVDQHFRDSQYFTGQKVAFAGPE